MPQNRSSSHSVALVGLGLIGGSIARDLAARKIPVLAYDTNGDALREAKRAGVIQGLVGPRFRELMDAQTVIFAAPVDRCVELLERAAPFLERTALITDVGSTKRAIVDAAQRLGLGPHFVGSHPIAGDHRKGFGISRAGLFAGARVILTPTRSTRPATLTKARALWKSMGACTEEMAAAPHDAEMAVTSHLHHLVSAALAMTMQRLGTPRSKLGPGGRDVTRLAGSSGAMWGAVVAQNAERIAPSLKTFAREIARLEKAVAAGDQRAIEQLFDRTNIWAYADD
jgi:prephenate dehydrogenase